VPAVEDDQRAVLTLGNLKSLKRVLVESFANLVGLGDGEVVTLYPGSMVSCPAGTCLVRPAIAGVASDLRSREMVSGLFEVRAGGPQRLDAVGDVLIGHAGRSDATLWRKAILVVSANPASRSTFS
jgi:hypothetical protein